MLYAVAGFAVGGIGIFFTRRMLPSVLEGRNLLGAVVIGMKLLWHILILAFAAMISREALLWAAGGDLLAMFGFVAYQYLPWKRG